MSICRGGVWSCCRTHSPPKPPTHTPDACGASASRPKVRSKLSSSLHARDGGSLVLKCDTLGAKLLKLALPGGGANLLECGGPLKSSIVTPAPARPAHARGARHARGAEGGRQRRGLCRVVVDEPHDLDPSAARVPPDARLGGHGRRGQAWAVWAGMGGMGALV